MVPHLQYDSTVYRQIGTRQSNDTLYLQESIVDAVHVEMWDLCQVCKEKSEVGCMSRDARCYDRFGSSWGENLYLLMVGTRYLLTGHDCLYDTRYVYFEVQYSLSPRLFALVSGSETIDFSVCSTYYTYVHYRTGERENIRELLRMEEVDIAEYSILIWYEYQ